MNRDPQLHSKGGSGGKEAEALRLPGRRNAVKCVYTTRGRLTVAVGGSAPGTWRYINHYLADRHTSC